jgi:hypothetical protein
MVGLPKGVAPAARPIDEPRGVLTFDDGARVAGANPPTPGYCDALPAGSACDSAWRGFQLILEAAGGAAPVW